MRRTILTYGVWSVLCEELSKLPALFRYRSNESIESLNNIVQTMKGDNPKEAPEINEKRRKHREAYEEILRQQQEQAKAESDQKMQGLSFFQRIKAQTTHALDAMKEMTSTNAGAMALLQHCTAAHAAEVAVEQGIDVRSVTMRLEKKKTGTQVGHESVVVGYIDAPHASEEELMAFAEKLQKSCPMAHSMRERIEWRNASSYGGTKGPADGPQEEISRGMPGAQWRKEKQAGGLDDSENLNLSEALRRRGGGSSNGKS